VNGGTIGCAASDPLRGAAAAINDGIAYITEIARPTASSSDGGRRQHLYRQPRPRLGWRFLLSRARRSKLANYWVERLKINALQRKARIVELSGGNQQKVVLAKTLVQEPSIIILDEPTRGVDVGTIPHIHAEIRRLADEGKAVV